MSTDRSGEPPFRLSIAGHVIEPYEYRGIEVIEPDGYEDDQRGRIRIALAEPGIDDRVRRTANRLIDSLPRTEPSSLPNDWSPNQSGGFAFGWLTHVPFGGSALACSIQAIPVSSLALVEFVRRDPDGSLVLYVYGLLSPDSIERITRAIRDYLELDRPD